MRKGRPELPEKTDRNIVKVKEKERRWRWRRKRSEKRNTKKAAVRSGNKCLSKNKMGKKMQTERFRKETLQALITTCH